MRRRQRDWQMGGMLARAAVAGLVIFAGIASTAHAGTSEWVHPGPDGKLVYKTTPDGDRIMDFSFAGYRGGGVKLPDVPAVETVKPGDGDASIAIQKAIDAVSQKDLVDGVRGAVVLDPGTYECGHAIVIRASGVVLRGIGPEGTTLKATGEPHGFIEVTAEAAVRPDGEPTPVTDEYVAAGAMSLHVASVAGFSVGQTVLINHPVTKAWVHFMQMDTLVRNGKKQTWLPAGSTISAQRKIAAINGNELVFDLPLSDCLDAKYLKPPGASVVRCSDSGQISEVGIEGLHLLAPPQAVTITDKSFRGVTLHGAADSWVKDLKIENTVGAVNVAAGCARVTVQNVTMHHEVPTKGAAKPADLDTDATQVLFDRCEGDGDNLFYFATMGRDIGPIVLLHCKFRGDGHIQPHMRWSTGLLLDNCEVPDSGIDLMNRGIYGSGHGWTIGWSVAWNCVAKEFTIEKPPGSMNWAIGCQGTAVVGEEPMDGSHGPKMLQGTYESNGDTVQPASLYLAQLRDRLGEEAVHAIGY